MASRNEKIQIDIGAKDNASKVIDNLAKKIDGMEADEARITVSAQTDKLEAQLDRAKQKLEGLDGDEASVQARLVGTLEEDLEQANKLLEQLDGETATVHIDSVGAKQGIDDLGKSADSSKSVLANMVGNSAQDVASLGGLAGSAGVAIGQMGEYMADARASGEKFGSVLKSFAGVALPIAALGVAMQGIKGHFDKIAQAKAFKTDQIEKWTDALAKGETLLEAINEELTSTNQIMVRGLGGEFDLVPILADAGLKTDAWTAAVQGNEAAQISFLQKIKESGVSDKELINVAIALQTETDNVAAAKVRAADASSVAVESTDKETDATDKLRTSHQRSKPVIDDNRASLDRHRKALDDAAAATDALREANELLRGDLDRREAYLNLQTTFDDLKQKGTDTLNAVRLGWVDAEDATRDFELAQIDAKQEVINLIDEIGNVPPETEAKILTLIDQGKLDEAEAEIAELTKPQVVDVSFNVRRVNLAAQRDITENRSVTSAGTSGFPTANQIAKQIGTVRVPMDVFVRSTPRVTGIRQ